MIPQPIPVLSLTPEPVPSAGSPVSPNSAISTNASIWPAPRKTDRLLLIHVSLLRPYGIDRVGLPDAVCTFQGINRFGIKDDIAFFANSSGDGVRKNLGS